MKEALIEYFKDNNIQSISDTNMTWKELGERYQLSGEAARHHFRNYKKLKLRSRWQVQTKGGETKWLESYRTSEEPIDFNSLLKAFEGCAITPYTPIVPYNVKNEDITVCHLADKHIGASGTKNNPYSSEEFESRMNYVFNKLIENPSKKLVITDLGDALDTNGLNSQTVRGGHNLETNMSATEIFETYLRVHKRFLENLLNHFKEIEYYHIYRSNHDGNFSFFAAKALQLLMPNIKFTILEDNLNIVKIGNFNYVLTHGKDDKHQMKSLPYVLTPVAENFINNFLVQNSIRNARFVKGDLHRFGITKVANFTYINCPSLFGSSNYAEHNFTPSAAGFIIEVINGFDLKLIECTFY